MTKTFVTFTDPHVRMKTPQSRTDTNWLEQCLGQIEAVFALADQKRARAVLCSGDVGDSPAWSDLTISGMYDILKHYEHIPFITTVGQHDVRGHRIEEWDKSSLGLLAKLSGLITVLESGKSLVLDHRVEVYGFGFNQPETIALLEGKYPFPLDNKRFKIALVHAQIGPEDSMGWKGIAHQNIRGCQIASFGDIHCGFDAYEFPSGTVAYSTGSLTRTSLSDLGRVPMCAVIKVEDDNSFELEFHEIPDGDDKVVFFTKETVQAAGDTAEEFKAMVLKAREHQDETPIKRLQRVGEANGFTARQIALATERLELVQ